MNVGDTLLAEMLEAAPCLLGGVAGLRLSRGKSHALDWHWQIEADGRQRLLPQLPPSSGCCASAVCGTSIRARQLG